MPRTRKEVEFVEYVPTPEEIEKENKRNRMKAATLVAKDAKAEWDAIEGYQDRLNDILGYILADQPDLADEVKDIYDEHISDELNHARELDELYISLTTIEPSET